MSDMSRENGAKSCPIKVVSQGGLRIWRRRDAETSGNFWHVLHVCVFSHCVARACGPCSKDGWAVRNLQGPLGNLSESFYFTLLLACTSICTHSPYNIYICIYIYTHVYPLSKYALAIQQSPSFLLHSSLSQRVGRRGAGHWGSCHPGAREAEERARCEVGPGRSQI